MRHISTDKTYREKARRELHENATGHHKQSWKQHLTKQQLYGHLPFISKADQIIRTRHARYCWRGKDEHIIDILQWTSSHGRACVDRSARTYQQLFTNTRCSLDDLLGTMDDRDGWEGREREREREKERKKERKKEKERVRETRTFSLIYNDYIYIYIY